MRMRILAASLCLIAVPSGFVAIGTAQAGKQPEFAPLSEIISKNPEYASSQSLWIIQYESPSSGKVTRVFEGPAPIHGHSITGKDGELGAPSPNDFGDPNGWAGQGIPNNGTVTWSGTVYGNNGSEWDTTVSWEGDGTGTWTITSFTTTQVDTDDELPSAEDE